MRRLEVTESEAAVEGSVCCPRPCGGGHGSACRRARPAWSRGPISSPGRTRASIRKPPRSVLPRWRVAVQITVCVPMATRLPGRLTYGADGSTVKVNLSAFESRLAHQAWDWNDAILVDPQCSTPLDEQSGGPSISGAEHALSARPATASKNANSDSDNSRP